jgi:hypothetical protein
MLLICTSNLGGTRRGEPIDSTQEYSALFTLIADESCGWAHILEAEVYV